MRMSVKTMTLCSALVFATSAVAATITPERGEVLVNRGSGYKLVTQPTQVAAGDQVMVKPKGSGRVVFPDGCSVLVAPGAVLTIAATSPCVRAGSHVETAASLPPNKDPQQTGNDALPFLTVAGVAAGMTLLPQKDKAASP